MSLSLHDSVLLLFFRCNRLKLTPSHWLYACQAQKPKSHVGIYVSVGWLACVCVRLSRHHLSSAAIVVVGWVICFLVIQVVDSKGTIWFGLSVGRMHLRPPSAMYPITTRCSKLIRHIDLFVTVRYVTCSHVAWASLENSPIYNDIFLTLTLLGGKSIPSCLNFYQAIR